MKRNTQIQIVGLPILMIVGLYPEERLKPQTILLDVSLSLGSRTFADTSVLEDTIDYANLVAKVRSFCTARDDGLLEVLGNALCDELMSDPRIDAMELHIHKPGAAEFLDVSDVVVSFYRDRVDGFATTRS